MTYLVDNLTLSGPGIDRACRANSTRYALAKVVDVLRRCAFDDGTNVGRVYQQHSNEDAVRLLGLENDGELQIVLAYHGLGQKSPGGTRTRHPRHRGVRVTVGGRELKGDELDAYLGGRPGLARRRP